MLTNEKSILVRFVATVWKLQYYSATQILREINFSLISKHQEQLLLQF